MPWKQLRLTQKTKIPYLLTLFCQKENQVYFRQGNGTLNLIHQRVGYAQGCPLSAVFASLVLGIVPVKLNIKLYKWAIECQHNKDSGLNEAIILMDDASNAILLKDAFWYLTELVEIGQNYGVILNLKKLTNIISKSLLDFNFSAEGCTSITNTLAMLDKGEITDSLAIVDTPIGSP
eukprot:14828944-Ditylum_brightwellii.AAC.1